MTSPARLKKINEVASKRQSGIILVLEDIYDPHNAAAVLRTCDAFGIQEVYFIFENQKYFNPRKIGKVASASANKWLDFKIYRSSTECLRAIKRKGYKIYATVLDEKAKDISRAGFANDKKIALLFGNEHAGLTARAVSMSDYKIYIPMRGFVQSLNLSVTAAIMIFEATRQRRKSKYSKILEKDAKILNKSFLKR